MPHDDIGIKPQNFGNDVETALGLRSEGTKFMSSPGGVRQKPIPYCQDRDLQI
jgi:hypothetical protein